MIASRKKNREINCRPAIIRAVLIILAGLSITTPAYADPLLIETGVTVGSFWIVLFAGLTVESLILALIIRRPAGEIITVSILANTVTGFVGFVTLLVFRLKGLPIVPIAPLLITSIAMEASMISLMLAKPPVKKILTAVTLANTASALIAAGLLLPVNIAPPEPGPDADIRMTSAISTVRNAINEYYDRYGYYPDALTGGRCNYAEGAEACSDPLIASGILESYPENPYAQSLFSRKFNPSFMLFGIGKPTVQVGLENPTNAWEARWFPAMRDDERFGGPDNVLLSANGLSDPRARETLESTFYKMNGADCIPGCFFYRSYDFNRDSRADDYILGAYGWPEGQATVTADIIDATTGEICLSLDSYGQIHAGEPDGLPESVLVIHIGGADPER